MAKYRKRTAFVEAYQWNGETPLPYPIVLGSGRGASGANFVMIPTLSGLVEVQPGDWIIKGEAEGDWYPCKNDVFHNIFDLVTDEPAKTKKEKK